MKLNKEAIGSSFDDFLEDEKYQINCYKNYSIVSLYCG